MQLQTLKDIENTTSKEIWTYGICALQMMYIQSTLH